MPEMLSRLDFYDIGRRYVIGRAERINPREIDTEGSDINLLVGAASYMANAVSRQNIERLSALLLGSVEDEDLDRYAYDRYDLLRKGASAAVVPLQLTRPTAAAGAGSVPIGTKVLSLDGIEYVTTTTANFQVASLTSTAEVRAAQAGKEFQVGANNLRRFDKPNEIFDSTIEINNADAAAGGEPAESNDIFRERIRDFWRAARRGTLGAIEFGALTVAGVLSAEAVEQLDNGIPNRLLELFIADSSGVANQVLANQVAVALNEYRAGGIYVNINTSRPIIVDLVLQLTFKAGVNTSKLTDDIRNSLVAFINSLAVNQQLLVADINTVLSRFRSDGLIPNDSSIVEPVGDIIPELGTTIRTRQENITIPVRRPMVTNKKEGPLTPQELIDLWVSTTDQGYNEPILDDPTSLALIAQMAEQFARASVSVDRNTQAMFIRPWSGQTAPPAAGEAKATTVLEFTRSSLLTSPLTLFAGMVVQNILTDYSKEGPIDVTTQRRYIVDTDVTLAPGETGPVAVPVTAERPGPGYNLPPPGTITQILQTGDGLTNTGATVIPGTGNAHELSSSVLPDVPVVGNIGAYMLLKSGANAGQVRRIVGFGNPVVNVTGGSALLAADGVFKVSAVSGAFQPGEGCEQAVSGATGMVLTVSNGYAVIQRNSGTWVAGQAFVGDITAETALVDTIEQSPGMIAEDGTAEWEVLGWDSSFQLTASNPDYPSGGISGFLDELGAERNINRSSGESDDDYRPRVAVPADVVSPNALIRAGNRILKPLCLEVCLREVGYPKFPGIFFDDVYDIPNFFDLGIYDITWSGGGGGYLPGERVSQINADGIITYGTMMMDLPVTGVGTPVGAPVAVGVERVQGPGFQTGLPMTGTVSGNVDTPTAISGGLPAGYRFVVMLSLDEFRGFFCIGVPDLPVLDTTGLNYDEGAANAYDATDIETNHYDADSQLVNEIYQQIYDAIDETRAAGVPFCLYIEDLSCA